MGRGTVYHQPGAQSSTPCQAQEQAQWQRRSARPRRVFPTNTNAKSRPQSGRRALCKPTPYTFSQLESNNKGYVCAESFRSFMSILILLFPISLLGGQLRRMCNRFKKIVIATKTDIVRMFAEVCSFASFCVFYRCTKNISWTNVQTFIC